MDLTQFPYLLLAFVFLGMCIGSFLNVVIYRVPEGKSVANPRRSVCPKCDTPIRAVDNIPVLSFMILGGKCRKCRQPISWRYPLVESLTGLFMLFVLLRFGLSVEAAVYFPLIAALIAVTFIDLDHRIIPDVITLPGIAVGLAASVFLPEMNIQASVIGVLTGGGSLWAVAAGYALLTKKEGMGGGDVKLLAMLGAFIGWQGVLFTIFTSSLTGMVVGFAAMAVQRKDMKLAVPFGPFLSFGAVLYLFYGDILIHWYWTVLA